MNVKKNGLRKVHAVDLFCGIGGLTHGLGLSGIDVKAGFDVDPSCRYAYETNNPQSEFVTIDVHSIRFRDIEPYFRNSDVTVMVGCAPCQPFSAHTRRTQYSEAENYSLVGKFASLVQEGTPDLISMENVPDLAKYKIFNQMLAVLDDLGYKYDYDILSCADYGVPQNRKRLVLVASRLGEISLPNPTREKTIVADFIQNLPNLRDGQISPVDPAHATLSLSPLNRERILQSKPGGTWKDWVKDIINECHRKAYYPASYGRMRWDALAPTITTQFCYYSTGRFGHPEQNRTISVREAALLQTFPRKYKLTEQGKPLIIHKIARQIGNAVPVKLAEAIGQSIMKGANVR